MREKLLDNWLRGNQVINPSLIFNNLKPDLSLGGFLTLDIAIDLHLAATIKTGNLEDSWKEHQKYISQAIKIAQFKKSDKSFDLDNEEKAMILDALGEPPECCYNIYLITLYKDNEEKLVYIGKTDTKTGRFKNGHHAVLQLHDRKYQQYYKRIYFGTLMFLTEKDYLPLEFVSSFKYAKELLGSIEGQLIKHFRKESGSILLNRKNEKLCEYCQIHIQNFTETDFLNDTFV